MDDGRDQQVSPLKNRGDIIKSIAATTDLTDSVVTGNSLLIGNKE